MHHRQNGDKKRALLGQRPVAVWMTGLPAAAHAACTPLGAPAPPVLSYGA